MLGALIAGFSLYSPALQEQGMIPKQYTCAGQDASPELRWQGAPPGTKSFALALVDPDHPNGQFTHWTVYNIPSNTTSLPPFLSDDLFLESGILQGMNDYKKIGYTGPCPPIKQKHSYIFTLYALDTILSLPPGRSYLELQDQIQGHVLEKTELTVFFSK